MNHPRKNSVFLLVSVLLSSWLFGANGSAAQVPPGKANITNGTDRRVEFYVKDPADKNGTWVPGRLASLHDALVDSDDLLKIITKNREPKVYRLRSTGRYRIIVNDTGTLELREMVLAKSKPKR
jgi:hypothetical protein